MLHNPPFFHSCNLFDLKLFYKIRVLVYLTGNIAYMKRKLFFGASFLFIAWAFTSCESLGCKFCKTVTYENGSVIQSGTETEYCGADLVTKENTPDIVVGSLVTKVECR
jgi:hypothetical protein